MSITAAAIRRDRVTYLVLLVLLLSGIGAYRALPRAEDPGFIIRTALVTTYFPGASPSRVEELVTDKIEKKVQEMPELDFVNSESRTGVSLVFVNIKESYTEMRPIWDDLRRKMGDVTQELPGEAVGPHVNDEFGDVFPIMLTITADGFNYAELKDIADDVRDELLGLSQVAKVEIYGWQGERIFVEYNNARLADTGISPSQLRSILASRNILISGGVLTAFGEDFALEPSGNYESIEDLAQTLIELPGQNEVVYLGDLAHIYRAYVDPPTSIMHSTGQRCVGLSISAPDETGNVSVLGEEVTALVEELRHDYPVGIDFDMAIYQPALINKLVDGFVVNLLEAIAIVMLVMFFALGVRTGLVVSTLIPTTMLITLFWMLSLDIGLDQISIAALIIALGMLVDNAIVMSESIMVQMAAGKTRLDAAVDSAHELRIPLLTSSLTTAAAFLPIYLAESSVGEYTSSIFKVVTLALLSSWALSMTLMPLLCMHLLRVKKQKGSSFGSPFYRRYRWTLLTGVRHPRLSLLGILLLFALAMYGMGFVPNVFMPSNSSPRLLADLDYPLGTAIGVTEETVFAIENYLYENHLADGEATEGFLNWSAYIGQKGGPRYRLAYNPSQDGSEHASMILTATSNSYVRAVIPEIEAWVTEHFPDLEQKWVAENMGPPADSPVEVRISGKDSDQLFAIVDQVTELMRQMPGTFNIHNNWGSRTKKIQVDINQARARRAGVSSQDVAVSLQSSLSGITITEFREDDKIIPVTMRSVQSDRTDLGRLNTLNIFSQLTGRSVPLSQIADIEVEWEPSKVLRRDLRRTVTIGSQVRGSITDVDLSGQLEKRLVEASKDWPRGFSYAMGGNVENSAKGQGSIAAKLPIAGFIILILLVAQFNSLRRTTIILLTIPLGMIGVTAGLLLTRQDFTFMALLGVVSLAGIIINNAIVLIDRITIEKQENGRSDAEAIIESAQRRLRPILSTTATTIGGLLPLYLFGGPMWEPMAATIMFGLLFATMLTLGVVPILYTLFFRVSFEDYTYHQE